MFAETWPTSCLSAPETVKSGFLSLVSPMTMVMPSGTSRMHGCAYPSARVSVLPLRSALKPTPLISRTLEKPSAAPFTIPAIMLLAVPNIASEKRESVAGLTRISSPSSTIFMAFLSKEWATLPLGPSTLTLLSATDALTPDGILTGSLPILLMTPPYQTLQIISPPTFLARHSESLRMPLEVVRIEMPMPLRTLGISRYWK